MREAVVRGPLRAPRRRAVRAIVPALLGAGSLLLGACSGDDADAAAEPGETPATPASVSATVSPSPTASPDPDRPSEPKFAPGRRGKRAFVDYVVAGWGYGLQTNDPSVLLDASGKRACRGCDTYRDELEQRAKENWYVQFPGATVRRATFRADGPVEVGRLVVEIPASQSFFEDGTFRNDNKAYKRARFLIDLRADGQGERRRWTLLAFSIK